MKSLRWALFEYACSIFENGKYEGKHEERARDSGTEKIKYTERERERRYMRIKQSWDDAFAGQKIQRFFF